MQIAFIILSITGLLYFLFAKRKFDFISTAWLSATVYFLPGFGGYVVRSFTLPPHFTPIESGTYWVMFAVLGGILLTGVISDLAPRSELPRVAIRNADRAPDIALLLALIGLACTFATSGSSLFMANKNILAGDLNRWMTLWEMCATLGAVLAFSYRRWLLLIAFGIMLLFDLYVGYRNNIASAVIAIFTLHLSTLPRDRLLVRQWKLIPGCLFLILFFFAYSQMFVQIKVGNLNRVVQLLSNPQFYLFSVANSEPLVTQSILNAVILSDFHVGMAHFASVLQEMLPFSPELGFHAVSFNELFQPMLFPENRWGMANNIWAEMWSSGGSVLLFIFIVFFNLLIWLGSWLITNVRDRSVQSLIAVNFTLWAFYIHRNDVVYEMNLIRDVTVVWLFCVVGSVLVTRQRMISDQVEDSA